jgi:hypothetical protein
MKLKFTTDVENWPEYALLDVYLEDDSALKRLYDYLAKSNFVWLVDDSFVDAEIEVGKIHVDLAEGKFRLYIIDVPEGDDRIDGTRPYFVPSESAWIHALPILRKILNIIS